MILFLFSVPKELSQEFNDYLKTGKSKFKDKDGNEIEYYAAFPMSVINERMILDRCEIFFE